MIRLLPGVFPHMKFSGPKVLLHLEGLAVLIASGALYKSWGFHWTEFVLLFFVPDLAMLGYLAGGRWGAWIYNLAHTYSSPLLLLVVAGAFDRPWLPIGFIWIAHIGFDRGLGFGLKYPTAFGDTHLNRV